MLVVGCLVLDVPFLQVCGEAMSEPGVPEKERWKKTRRSPHKKIPCFMGEQHCTVVIYDMISRNSVCAQFSRQSILPSITIAIYIKNLKDNEDRHRNQIPINI